jgi:Domain of unknown function (DUF5615)
VAEELRRLGHDVLTIYEMGQAGQAMPDEIVLAFACADRRALLTLNRKHFTRLHAIQPQYAGIIVCTFDPDFIEQADYQKLAYEDIRGQRRRAHEAPDHGA